ncbi:hypothetical protein OSH10_08255 [Kaistia defluvii]|uniref:hypothetical protein n=1 Tax=Kaistia defluvii TaxID=410841 RepID=UPI00225B25BE|nr:hypothetical protein [Kaistia defluvii]MCX5518425.1 hypothetical protein [Kaistia defluvii]
MPDVSSLPDWLRSILYVGGLLGAAFACFVGYFIKGKAQPTDDLVITAASIADTKPIKELVEEVRGLGTAFRACTAAIEDIRDLMRDAADEAEIERRAEEKAEAKLQRILKRLPSGHNK